MISSSYIYRKIGSSFFNNISSFIAGLWVNNGFLFFNDFMFWEAMLLNLFFVIPTICGFWISKKLQTIDKIISLSLRNDERLDIKEANRLQEDIADGFIQNNKSYKQLGTYSILWFLWVLSLGFSIVWKISN
ncbi:MAG: hypothetical protein HOP31_02560 [Ignavibacteria bacterium]|nr:hypothetical protein [Ignavibacteria bacterium]